MLAVLIKLTPGCRNEFIDCHRAKVRMVALPMMDVKTPWNSIAELLKHQYQIREFAGE
jgi:hypothetical protein